MPMMLRGCLIMLMMPSSCFQIMPMMLNLCFRSCPCCFVCYQIMPMMLCFSDHAHDAVLQIMPMMLGFQIMPKMLNLYSDHAHNACFLFRLCPWCLGFFFQIMPMMLCAVCHDQAHYAYFCFQILPIMLSLCSDHAHDVLLVIISCP